MGLKTQTLVQCLIECAECDSYRSGTRTVDTSLRKPNVIAIVPEREVSNGI